MSEQDNEAVEQPGYSLKDVYEDLQAEYQTSTDEEEKEDIKEEMKMLEKFLNIRGVFKD